MSLRERVLELAQEQLELGVAEVPAGSNTGPEIRHYLAGCVRGGHLVGLRAGAWCAAFASWVLWTAHRDLVADTMQDQPAPPVQWRASVAELVADAKAAGRWHLRGEGEPQPGDLLVCARMGEDPQRGGHGHAVIVEAPNPDGGTGWQCIGGNEQNAVRRTVRGDGGLQDRAEPVLGWIEIEAPSAPGT